MDFVSIAKVITAVTTLTGQAAVMFAVLGRERKIKEEEWERIIMAEREREREAFERKREAFERKREAFERKREEWKRKIIAEREREREELDREREEWERKIIAVQEREREAFERKREEWERKIIAVQEREREALDREREELDREREALERKREGRSSLALYEMSRRPRGLCLIINNKNFDDARDNRNGSEIDERNLEELFEELCFTVHVKNDLDAEQMRQVAKEFAEKDHSDFDAFIFIIMSHGGNKDVILGVDGRNVQIEDLMYEFKADNCPTLKNKPKLFFTQTCRGVLKSTVSSADIGDAAFSPDSTLSKSVCPHEADFLLAFSTAPGYVAFRNKQSGSRFVQVLVETIRENHNNYHLIEILTEVTRRVVDEGKGNQVPAPTSTLRGQLWL